LEGEAERHANVLLGKSGNAAIRKIFSFPYLCPLKEAQKDRMLHPTFTRLSKKCKKCAKSGWIKIYFRKDDTAAETQNKTKSILGKLKVLL
jgi:hypothetical protein